MHAIKLAAIIAVALLFPASTAYGHGTGIDVIKSLEVQERKITVSVEAPTYFEGPNNKQITITATDDATRETVKNITYMIGLYHEGRQIFSDHFFAPDGILYMDVGPGGPQVQIHGQRDGPLDAWRGGGSAPLEITGPVFDSGGLYTFEIKVRTIDDPENTADSETYYADLTLVDTVEFLEADSNGQDVKFGLKSYFDEVSYFDYDPVKKQVVFEMPFDWSEKRMSHIPVVHEEVRFPKGFAEFLHPSYVGKVNGIDLFKASVTVDDYTEEDVRIVHFVLLQDHLHILKNQQKTPGEPLPDSMVFTLSASDEVVFPLTAFTRSEDFQVDLSWDPIVVEPDQKTNFVFTIRDGSTGEPMRNSDYTFVILQGGQEVYRISGQAQVGGDFESYKFAEDQTGPTTIRFENIRNSGQDTEFGIMVVPEFGGILVAVLVIGMAATVLVTRHGFSLTRSCR